MVGDRQHVEAQTGVVGDQLGGRGVAVGVDRVRMQLAAQPFAGELEHVCHRRQTTGSTRRVASQLFELLGSVRVLKRLRMRQRRRIDAVDRHPIGHGSHAPLSRDQQLLHQTAQLESDRPRRGSSRGPPTPAAPPAPSRAPRPRPRRTRRAETARQPPRRTPRRRARPLLACPPTSPRAGLARARASTAISTLAGSGGSFWPAAATTITGSATLSEHRGHVCNQRHALPLQKRLG